MNHHHAAVHSRPYAGHVHHARRERGTLTRTIHRIFRFVIDRYLALPIGAAVALVWANTAPDAYFTTAHRLAFVVNEVGMAFFFALLAQEVVDAMMPGGSLHSWRRWTMPLVAAAGGIVGAVAVYWTYLYYGHEDVLSPAWPVACAVDAAATYYLLKAILPRSAAIPFALLVAIVTDAFGLFVVAPRYLVLETRIGGAVLVMTALAAAVVMRAMGVRAFWPYLVFCGAMSWLAFYWEGLHPAFALIPIVPLLPHERRTTDVFANAPDDDAVHHAEHEWHLLVQAIVFLFGLVNAGVMLNDYDTGSWAVLTAQLVGRPAGILAGVGFGLLAGLHLPKHVGWRELLVVALAASAGFSIALFFATGLLATGPVLAETKVGILASAAGLLIAVSVARALHLGRYAR